jgi:anti-sigma factor RsiW
MIDMPCTYPGDRREAIVEYLYGELEPLARSAFEQHVSECTACRAELAGMRATRTDLSAWAPPDLESLAVANPWPPAAPWWARMPVWAQAAAALLCVGVGFGAANLDVRYDQQGVSVHTGWRRVPVAPVTPVASAAPGSPAAPVAQATAVSVPAAAPWQADLAALEERLRSARAERPVATRQSAAPDAELLRRVRALVDESEQKQQRELAFRLAEMVRERHAQRQADLVRIDRSLGMIQNSSAVETMRQRQALSTLAIRVSQKP